MEISKILEYIAYDVVCSINTFDFRMKMGCKKRISLSTVWLDISAEGSKGFLQHFTCQLFECKRMHVAVLQSNTFFRNSSISVYCSANFFIGNVDSS